MTHGDGLFHKARPHEEDPDTPGSSVRRRNLVDDVRVSQLPGMSHATLEVPAGPMRPPLSREGSHESVPVYKGSYAHTSTASPRQWFAHSRIQSTASLNPSLTGAKANRTSFLRDRLERLFGDDDDELRQTYGLEELRQGFFDGIFLPPTAVEAATKEQPEFYVTDQFPQLFSRPHRSFADRITALFVDPFHKLLGSREGIKFVKAFTSYFICYILCLVSPVASWLGPNNYFMPFAAMIHHPGRTAGSQLELTAQSIVGLALGLGWGSLGLFLSTCTGPARSGFGGIHAASIVLCVSLQAWIRAGFYRLHHGPSTFFFAVFFLEVVDVGTTATWRKVWNFGMPSLLGIVMSLVVNLVVLPDAGHHLSMTVLDNSLATCKEAVEGFFNNESSMTVLRKLSRTSLDYSESVRELANEVTFSTLKLEDSVELRNRIQTAISRIRAVPPARTLFTYPSQPDTGGTQAPQDGASIVREAVRLAARELVFSMSSSLQTCRDYVAYLNTGKHTAECTLELERRMADLDEKSSALALEYRRAARSAWRVIERSINQDMYDILLLLYYLNEASVSVASVTKQFHVLSLHSRSWKLSMPNYPLHRALRRSTRQIIHDLGGQTAVYYFWAKKEVDEVLHKIRELGAAAQPGKPSDGKGLSNVNSNKLGYRIWLVLHQMQGIESRFALRSVVAVTLCSLPAWLASSRGWYNLYDCWIGVVLLFLCIHARGGGNIRDLAVRCAFCLAGGIWGGLAYRARYGDPVVLGVFSGLFMSVCLYRYICTPHPRSGIIGSVSFTLVSLSLYNERSGPVALFTPVWTRVVSCLIAVCVSMFVNWILWPVITRHAVRKSISVLLSHISETYQMITDQYLYRDKGEHPSAVVVLLSEVLENRLIRSLFAVADLLKATRHEVSLRGAFNEAPYASVLFSCESIINLIIRARISSIRFSVYGSDETPQDTKRLKATRRDAVAAVVFVMYILSGSYACKSPVPKFLPSVAMSRKNLLDAIEEVDFESHMRRLEHGTSTPAAVSRTPSPTGGAVATHYEDYNLWRDVHLIAFSRAVTIMAEELEKLIGSSKHILGEQQL